MNKEAFGDYEKITIENEFLSLTVMNLGATMTSLKVDGEEVLLSYATPEEYLNGSAYIGAIVGRNANRIDQARFTLNGKEYELTPNEGKNQLHGGPNAFDQRVWNIDEVDENHIKLSIFSPDGDNGYPGNLNASVTYTLEDNQVFIDFEAQSDEDTIFAPTTHNYFNLGHLKTVFDTEIKINADEYLPVNEELLPLEKAPCVDEFNFKGLRPIKQNYDHCFILNDEKAVEAHGGHIQLLLETDFPGLQLYTGEYLNDAYCANEGFAIEPAYLPNTPNRPDFPSCVLHKGETFHKYVKYTLNKIQ